MSLPRSLSILGSTGSVGTSTLDLLEKSGGSVEVVALTAGANVHRLIEQARQWRPKVAVIADETRYLDLKAGLDGTGIEVAAGQTAVAAAAGRDAQWVMSSIVGTAGLAPTLAAARAGAVIGLANKESLVCAGPALLRLARQSGGMIIPVDSEHSAIFQVFDPRLASQVYRLMLTASGGPFRTWTLDEMARATCEQAVAHPRWDMGPKISVDSATLMNKGLEMIEAAYLFSMPPEKIDVVVHPESIIHSLVEYLDGSTLAQLGVPDMRTPIACALAWPDRLNWPAPRLNLAAIGQLTFEDPDLDRFPALGLAKAALKAGGNAPAVLNAANEVAVAAFLDRRIGFLDIAAIVADTVERVGAQSPVAGSDSEILEQVQQTDANARRVASARLLAFA